MDFASRLRELREAALLTQGELAHRSGIAKTTISSYEQGRRKPEHATVEKLANAIGVEMSEFSPAKKQGESK
jgi:transcriptional regulator with XRE-family HTH domain